MPARQREDGEARADSRRSRRPLTPAIIGLADLADDDDQVGKARDHADRAAAEIVGAGSPA